MKAEKIISIMLVVMCGLFFRPAPAEATLVTIEIEAVVDYVGDPQGYLEGKIKPGDIITGFYIYESTTHDSNPSQNGGRYEHTTPPHGIFLSVSGLDFETDLTNVDFIIEVENDHPPDDNYFFASHSNLHLPNGTAVDYIFWHLYDPTGSALSSDALPTTAPILTDWQSNNLGISGDPRGKAFGINAHVTSAIPEPSTFLLLVFGGFMLRRRN